MELRKKGLDVVVLLLIISTTSMAQERLSLAPGLANMLFGFDMCVLCVPGEVDILV